MNNGKLAQRAMFIVLEGIDGCGSTTQGVRLLSGMRDAGLEAYLTHEPSNGPAGMMIRLALSKRLMGSSHEFHDPSEQPEERDTAIDPYTLALLYAADRMDHLATDITPNLNKGRIVICDRYILSTLAYQGPFVDEEWLMDINRFARQPDLTIFLDVPVEAARLRMRKTRWKKDLYETEDQLRVVSQKYQELLHRHQELLGPVEIIDGGKSIEAVTKQIRAIIESHFAPANPNGSGTVRNLFDEPETERHYETISDKR